MQSFQVKSFLSIAASMINKMRGSTGNVTDFNVGSIVRTMLEAVAQEIDQLYQQMVNSLKAAIQTATYLTFGFTELPAVNASGQVVVSIVAQSMAVTIPAGTTFSPAGGSGTVYTASAATVILIGQTSASVQVVASVAGIAGNLAANTAFALSIVPPGFIVATNPAAFINGAPAETASARQLRFQQFISNLARSPVAGVTYGCKTAQLVDGNGNVTERVVLAYVYEPYELDNTQPVGLYYCYVHNGVGSTSSALVAQAQKVVNGYTDSSGNLVIGYKAAGTRAVVAAATEQALQVAGVLTPAAGYMLADVIAAVTATHGSYLLSLGIGQPAHLEALYGLAWDTPGVADLVISSPTADVAVAYNVKLMPAAAALT